MTAPGEVLEEELSDRGSTPLVSTKQQTLTEHVCSVSVFSFPAHPRLF